MIKKKSNKIWWLVAVITVLVIFIGILLYTNTQETGVSKNELVKVFQCSGAGHRDFESFNSFFEDKNNPIINSDNFNEENCQKLGEQTLYSADMVKCRIDDTTCICVSATVCKESEKTISEFEDLKSSQFDFYSKYGFDNPFNERIIK